MITARIGKNRYHTDLTASGYQLVADEQPGVGGGNEGPAPGEFLMMALASCTAITLRMYADRKKWEVEEITVEVDQQRLEASTHFNRKVYLKGTLDATQRDRMLQIANSCPVHKILTHPITLDTSLL